jgi:hypothetical protein
MSGQCQRAWRRTSGVNDDRLLPHKCQSLLRIDLETIGMG